MASKGYLAKKDRENKYNIASKEISSREKIASEDRAQRERASRREAATKVAASLIGLARPTKNDPSWYKHWLPGEGYATLPKFTSTLQTRYMAPVRVTKSSGAIVSGDEWNTPQTLTLFYMPSLGLARRASLDASQDTDSAFVINQGFLRNLAQIAKINSRSVPADMDVMGLYILGSIEIASCLVDLGRLLGIANYFNAELPYIRESALGSLMGTGAATYFLDHIAEFRKIYSYYAKKFNEELPLPNLPLVQRRAWLSGNVARDEDATKAIHIIPAQFMFGRVTPDADGITYKQLNGTQYSNRSTIYTSSETLRAHLDACFNSILTDVDFVELQGNLRAAINNDQFYKLQEDAPTEVQFIDADDEFKMQMHNANLLPVRIDNPSIEAMFGIKTNGTSLNEPATGQIKLGDYSVAQATTFGALVASFTDKDSGPMEQDKLDFYKGDIGTDDILVATRFHSFIKYKFSGSTTDSTLTYLKYSEGTENMLWGEFSSAVSGGTDISGLKISRVHFGQFLDIRSDSPEFTNNALALNALVALDWAPKVYVIGPTATATVSMVYPLWQSCFYINYGLDIGDDINELCVKSLAYIPEDVFGRGYRS